MSRRELLDSPLALGEREKRVAAAPACRVLDPRILIAVSLLRLDTGDRGHSLCVGYCKIPSAIDLAGAASLG